MDKWLMKGPICLMAAELSNPADEEFPVENILDPNKKVRIKCSEVKEIEVFPTYQNEDHYIIRAIKDNPTYITGDEIDEFLNVVGDSTFAVIKVHDDDNNSSAKFYFMALSPFFMRFPRSNYDYDIQSNLNLTTTSSSNFKNEKIVEQALYDGQLGIAKMVAESLYNKKKYNNFSDFKK